MISGNQIKSWQDYERYAYDVFRSTGHQCERNVCIQGVRGSHQIDAIVNISFSPASHLWLVECKHWSRRVGKRDVQSFKTVIDDVGADHGYLLSEIGFQKGALDMARTLNLSLCSLSQLEEHFRNDQLLPTHQQSHAYRVNVTTEEDNGNLESSSTVDLIPKANKSVSDEIIEIHVLRENSFHWIISKEKCNKLLKSDGSLSLLLPWDPIHLCNIECHLIYLNNGDSISGPYNVVFRTLAGPVYVKSYVPLYK